MTIVVRDVDIINNSIKIEKYCLEYLKIDDTFEKSLFDELVNVLKKHDLYINNVRGPSYDSGSNMKEKHQGDKNYYWI